MKRVIVVRHAKSSWKHPELSDHKRPLNKRGKRDAPRVGRALATMGWAPQRVLSSDSVRTRQTWKRVARAFDDDCAVCWLPAFYHGGVAEVLDELVRLPESVDTVLVLGHNPGWESLVFRLCGIHQRMTTANAALLHADGTWDDLTAEGAWDLVTVIRPKDLPERG